MGIPWHRVFFAIRHKPSGGLLPCPPAGGAATYVEPSSTKAPRLFKSRSHAATALKWWLDGKWGWREYSTGRYDPPEVEIDVVQRVPSRKASDMEIVKVAFRVIGTEES